MIEKQMWKQIVEIACPCGETHKVEIASYDPDNFPTDITLNCSCGCQYTSLKDIPNELILKKTFV